MARSFPPRSCIQICRQIAITSRCSFLASGLWNLGVALLLWVVSPERIDLYNTYERPLSADDASSHLLHQFRLIEQELASLDDYASRLAMASGAFCAHEDKVRCDGRVDVQLLKDLQEVERKLRR